MQKSQCSNQQNGQNGVKICSLDEYADLVERILQNLNTVFDKDDLLDEFAIIPVESQSNRSPVIHLSHKLALESWCIPFLYTYSFRNFLSLLPSKKSPSSRKSSNQSELSNNKFGGKHSDSDRFKRGDELSRTLILLNPDLTIAWNFRRLIYEQGIVTLKSELNFTALVSTRKPKCSELFSYRKWILIQYFPKELPQRALDIFEKEANFAEKASNLYFSNYHAWNYRHWLIKFILNFQLIPDEEKEKILHFEKETLDKWTQSHISDYSGFHYRQIVLLLLLERNNVGVQELTKESLDNQNMIKLYPGHEGLWYHRRFILTQFQTQLKGNQMEIDKLIETERKFLSSEKFQSELSDKVDYKTLNILYSKRHVDWTLRNLKWNLNYAL